MELRDFDLSNHYYELAGQFFDEMNVSEQWTYLNNRGNHYYYRKNYQEALKYMRRANALVSSYPQMVFEQNFIKVNLGELYLLTDKLTPHRSAWTKVIVSSPIYSITRLFITLKPR